VSLKYQRIAGGQVILVLDPDFGAQAPRQQRPSALRAELEVPVDHIDRRLDLAAGRQGWYPGLQNGDHATV
jgi:hypothetical protein